MTNSTVYSNWQIKHHPKVLYGSLKYCVVVKPGTLWQVLEMLQHVNLRVRDHRQIKLPLEELLTLYLASGSLLVRNFALMYVEMAFERSSPEAKAALVRP